jgi:hypothetical protein
MEGSRDYSGTVGLHLACFEDFQFDSSESPISVASDVTG